MLHFFHEFNTISTRIQLSSPNRGAAPQSNCRNPLQLLNEKIPMVLLLVTGDAMKAPRHKRGMHFSITVSWRQQHDWANPPVPI